MRAVTYTEGHVGLADPIVAGGNEELCIQVPTSDATAVTLAGGSNAAAAGCTGGETFTCTLTWNPDFTSDVTTYARFRLTTDPDFFTTASPSPLGQAADGEVEDYRIDISPTAVSIARVMLEAVTVADFLAGLGVDPLDAEALLALLAGWDADAAARLANADAATLLAALTAYLDPDGDGKVAVLEWDTAEERGTIGFWVERSESGEPGNWHTINDDMLPGLITAPMGGTY